MDCAMNSFRAAGRATIIQPHWIKVGRSQECGSIICQKQHVVQQKLGKWLISLKVVR